MALSLDQTCIFLFSGKTMGRFGCHLEALKRIKKGNYLPLHVLKLCLAVRKGRSSCFENFVCFSDFMLSKSVLNCVVLRFGVGSVEGGVEL